MTLLRAIVITSFLMILSGIPPRAAKAEEVRDACGLLLTKEQERAYWGRRAVDLRKAKPEFPKETVEFLRDQRNNLRALVTQANTTLVEMREPTKRMIQTLMLEAGSYTYGPPGGAKSFLGDLVLKTPQEALDGKIAASYFGLQFNPQLGDYTLRGYVDRQNNLFTEGTMLHSKYAMLDEIHNASGSALSAMLDLLAERVAKHGSRIVPSELRAIIATSNMSAYEFLEAYRAQFGEPMARALLDRLPFKIYIHNYPVNESFVSDAIRVATERSEREAESRLMTFFNLDAPAAGAGGARAPIDYSWFGALARRLVRSDTVTEKFFADIINEMRGKVRDKRLSSAQALLDSQTPGQLGYYPTTIFSLRNVMKYSKDVVAVSIFYDLMILPEEVLSTDMLVRLLEEGFTLTPESAWRLQDVLVTTTPSAPKLVKTDTGLSLTYGDELSQLIAASPNPAERELLGDLATEHQFFRETFDEVYAKFNSTNHKVGEIASEFLDLLGPAPKKGSRAFRNVEEWLMLNGGH